jgi:DNA-binding XRE family transcriptional regulator
LGHRHIESGQGDTMISNERQYRVTKAQAEKFSRALQEAIERSGVDPLLQKLENDALQSQLHDLEQELREYERLRSAEESVLTLDSFAELPRALVKARVASGLTQKDLADRLGLKEQQIQRYEATEYTAASVRRLRQVIEALGIRVHADIFLAGRKAST